MKKYLKWLFNIGKIEIGDDFVHESTYDSNPFRGALLIYRVKEIKNGWALCEFDNHFHTRSIELRSLRGFYRKIER